MFTGNINEKICNEIKINKGRKKKLNEKENAMVWKPSRASACVSDKITHFK